MTAGQIKVYRVELAKWRAACTALGRPCDEAARMALHAECGAPSSSTQFTNAQLDRVLAKFRSFSDGGNLAAQLRPDADAERRRNAAQRRCYDAVATLTRSPSVDDPQQSRRRANYLESMAQRICKRSFDGLDEAALFKLAHVLESRAGTAPAAALADAEFRTVDPVEF